VIILAGNRVCRPRCGLLSEAIPANRSMDVSENLCVQVLRMQGVGRSSRGNLRMLDWWREHRGRATPCSRTQRKTSLRTCEGVLRQVRLAEEEGPLEQRR
jgi:hypothetical protein